MLTNDEIINLAKMYSILHTKDATYAGIVDFSRLANEHRLFVVNVKKGEIAYSWYTSHGSGSGPKHGDNLKLSNKNMSRKSSRGLMKTAETYYGKYGYSLRLDGLMEGMNDKVRSRAVVIHRSEYVSKNYMKRNKYPGRSWGCITLEPSDADDVINMLKGGSIIYVHK